MFNNFKYGVAAIALGGAIGMAVDAGAQVFTAEIDATVTVDNSFTVTGTTDVAIGTVGVATNANAADPDPTIGVTTAGVRVPPGGGDVNNFFIDFGGAIAAGQFDITGAAPNTDIDLTVDNANVVNLTNGTDTFTIVNISLNDGTVNSNANPNAGNDVTLTINTDGNGDSTILVGTNIQADSTEALYSDGVYTGTIQLDAQY